MFPMLKQKQRWLHLEDGRCGDCIAGYLGMVRDSVPHFVELHGGEDWNDSEAIARAIELWMKERGLVMISVNGEVPFSALASDVAKHWLPGVDRRDESACHSVGQGGRLLGPGQELSW